MCNAELDGRVSVVIATRDRPADLARTLDRLGGMRPVPPVIVVDNASRRPVLNHPVVSGLIRLERNLGGAGRTVGARRATTRYVAFSDDDSWWAPDALRLAANSLDRHPRLALVAARTLVGPDHRPDPLHATLTASPLLADGLPARIAAAQPRADLLAAPATSGGVRSDLAADA